MDRSARGALTNVFLVIVSTLLALLLIEVALRLTGSEPMYVSPERDRFWKYDPLLGWAHQPGQVGIFETDQFRTAVGINEDGLRDGPHSHERQDDLPRILVLGDSFAWGYGVEESERFSELLEKAMDVEVINAGVSGYSTDQELIWYEHEGIKYETDLVILVLTGNDVGDNDKELVSRIYYKPKFVFEGDRIVATGYPVPKTGLGGRLIYSASERSALAYFLAQRYFDLLSIYGHLTAKFAHASATTVNMSTAAGPFELTIALLDEMKSAARSRNAEFMIVATDRWWDLPAEETYENFISNLQSEGFLVLDVESMPGFDPEKMLIPDDGHWNEDGHEFVEQQIEAFIETHQLLKYPTSGHDPDLNPNPNP